MKKAKLVVLGFLVGLLGTLLAFRMALLFLEPWEEEFCYEGEEDY